MVTQGNESLMREQGMADPRRCWHRDPTAQSTKPARLGGVSQASPETAERLTHTSSAMHLLSKNTVTTEVHRQILRVRFLIGPRQLRVRLYFA